jgi:cation diffusion facilitator CzcD-associated flavoprotein CzcO
MSGLAELEAQVRRDLTLIDHPDMRWLVPRRAPDGSEALDVLIVGAGQSGTGVGFGLKRAKVENILLVDRAARGKEGPWLTFARMHTLRSPKHYTGPDLDVPSLTYRAWHEARFGEAAWAELVQIPRELWAEYLLWVRDVTELPVQNETEVVDIADGGGLLAVTLRGPGGTRTVYCRKLVLATGQDGAGRWWMPDFVAELPAERRAHTADAIDFAALRGLVVAVLGTGASALDNAAAALEAGAEVDVFCRRATPQLVQSYRWLTFAGFLRHLSDLEDEWRWRFMSTIVARREGLPQATWDRCVRWPGFRLHNGAGWRGARMRDGRVEIDTVKGRFTADYVICGTGIEVDFSIKPELVRFGDNVATWGDRYVPPPELRNDRLARYPYLAPDYSLVEKVPGVTPWISDVHLFTIASTMSFGPSGSSINAMTSAVPKLVSGITRGLFRADIERHWAEYTAYDVKQADIGAFG